MRPFAKQISLSRLALLITSLLGILIYAACGLVDEGSGTAPSQPVISQGPSSEEWTGSEVTFIYSANAGQSSSGDILPTTFYCSLNAESYFACGRGEEREVEGRVTLQARAGSNVFRVYASNGYGMSSSVRRIWSVDTSPPFGGNISSPKWSEEKSFDLAVSPFVDPHSGMRSNVLQRRYAHFVQSACSETWDEWQDTSSSQENLENGCWQYRLYGTNNVGLSALSKDSLTEVYIPTSDDKAEMSILSLRGPKYAQIGKRVKFSLRVQNKGSRFAKGVILGARGSRVSARRVAIGDVRYQGTESGKITLRFKEKGRARVVFFVSEESGSRDAVVRFVRVR